MLVRRIELQVMRLTVADDGYRLTYGGLDYLSLNTHRKNSTIFSVGNQIGVGKESDIYVVASESGKQLVLKIHRLGRISFRTVKANRDYLRNRSSGSWLYLSRLAAMKEYAFMQVLRREGFPVPEPIGQSRHTVVMELINSFPLRQIDSVPDPASLYAELLDMIVRLARVGLIHGDFNEFNILIKEEKVKPDGPIRLVPVLIDFPQMLSITHSNAAFYFDRDVACVKRFFSRRFHFKSDEPGPFFADAIKGSGNERRLDVEVEATGFSKKLAKDLEKYIDAVGRDEEGSSTVADGDVGEITNENDDNDNDDDDDDVEADGHSPFEIPDDAQIDDPELAEQLGQLGLGHLPDTTHGNVFASIDLPTEPEVANGQMHSKKKAAGWAI